MKDQYLLNKSSTINVTDSSFNTASLELNLADNLPNRFTGTVQNTAGGLMMANAFVAVYDASGTFTAGGYTDANGLFAIELPDAIGYEAFASAVGFAPSDIHVFDIQGGSIDYDFSLTAYGSTDRVVYGKIFEEDGTTPINGARIDIIDDAGVIIASTTSIPDGEYSVPDLEEGNYTLVVSMTGYNIIRENFTIDSINTLINRDIDLTEHSAPTTSTISGTIKVNGGSGIPNAWVGLYSLPEEQLLKTTSTNSTGFYSFEDVASGNYIIKSKAVTP